MSRTLFIDPVAGLAGDMICGALLDAGGDLERLRRDLEGLGVEGVVLDAEKVTRGAFVATHFRVRPADADAGNEPAAPQPHDHRHEHAHAHGHQHAHDHRHPTEPAFPGQPERTLAAIVALLDQAPLPDRARQRAQRVFEHLAGAEGQLHGQPPELVHLHEVGSVDAIHDIVGACLLLEQFDVARVVCGPVPLGSGTVVAAHGRIPLPAPATVALLRGWPVVSGQPGAERTTPTGAALIAALAEPGPLPAMLLDTQGFGAGTRNPPDHANVCRVLLGRETAAHSPSDVVVLTAQMDDLSGEHLPPLLDALLSSGALDAIATPVLMKKGRSGLRVEALATPTAASAVAETMLRHGSTFGVRHQDARRTVLDRWHTEAHTPWGPVRVKVGALHGEVLHLAPEHEDVAAVARAAGQPVPRVHSEAIRALDGAPNPPESEPT